MKWKTMMTACLAGILAVSVLAGCGSEKKEDAKKPLRVATNATFVPFEFKENDESKEYQGFEIWVSNYEPEADTLLASNILSAIDKVGITDNRNVNYGFFGEPQSNYHVNRCTHMPSCLCEMGFITNEEDNEYYDKYMDEYAQAIADAVEKTAVELEIVDENGKRLISTPYLSTKPQWDSKTQSFITKDEKVNKSVN